MRGLQPCLEERSASIMLPTRRRCPSRRCGVPGIEVRAEHHDFVGPVGSAVGDDVKESSVWS